MATVIPTGPVRIKVNYTQNPDAPTQLVNGVYGGMNVSGTHLCMHFFVDKLGIPDSVDITVDPKTNITSQVQHPNNPAAIRDIIFTGLFDEGTVELLIKFLTDKVEDFKKVKEYTEKFSK